MGRTIMMPAAVAKRLRQGLLVEMGDAAECLAELTLPGELGHELAYHAALWRIEGTRSLLSRIGVAAPIAAERAVELDLDEYPLVILEVLKSQRLAQIQRAQDARAEGLTRAISDDRLLSEFIAAIEETIGGSAKRSAKAKRERRLSGSFRAERILRVRMLPARRRR
jgi:hypothetical protein